MGGKLASIVKDGQQTLGRYACSSSSRTHAHCAGVEGVGTKEVGDEGDARPDSRTVCPEATLRRKL